MIGILIINISADINKNIQKSKHYLSPLYSLQKIIARESLIQADSGISDEGHSKKLINKGRSKIPLCIRCSLQVCPLFGIPLYHMSLPNIGVYSLLELFYIKSATASDPLLLLLAG